MRNLRLRRAARTSALGTAALITALSLTACQGDGTTAADDAAVEPTVSASQQPAKSPATPTKTPDTAKDTNGSDSASGDAKGSGPGSVQPAAKQPRNTGDSGPATLACDGGNTRVTLAPVTRPVNHMLLTVTNTGSKACNAYHYPFLRFGDAQSAPRAVEASKPQAVVTLAPGATAYAGVMTESADGSGTGGYSTKDVTVSFQGREGSGSSGPSTDITLGKDVYVDSSAFVTHWQTSMDDALMH
ncbi:DUF4232 domain-containing protein [Streptomyces finlayi]|uniref:DUF4232 domain-containing protein n=1 Tax=Streptomyces finlayi TaxID=67296 RepID=A0A7G7BMZ5_9ACTN|nr:DUF4232 domain-containing protein [Streptomyces finlayi]QNE76710.1 DUF4232 domain-containing protein [Streptomyces finlayi]